MGYLYHLCLECLDSHRIELPAEENPYAYKCRCGKFHSVHLWPNQVKEEEGEGREANDG